MVKSCEEFFDKIRPLAQLKLDSNFTKLKIQKTNRYTRNLYIIDVLQNPKLICI
jgi:hypothetical protein